MKTKNQVEPNKIFSIFGRVLNVLPFKLKIMKKLMMVATIILAIAMSCNNKTKTDPPQSNGTVPPPNDTVPAVMEVDCGDNIICKYCCSQDDHEISFDSVLILIRNYQKSFGAAGLNSGAVFGKDEISLTTDSFLSNNKAFLSLASTAFYPAMETINQKNYFYLSTQPRLCKDTEPEPACSLSVEFKPEDQVYRSAPKTSFTRFQNSALKDTSTLRLAITQQITKPEDCIEDRNLEANSGSFQENYGYIHESPAMIYQKGITILELLDFTPKGGRTVAGIRYYFGLDFNNSKHPLRVILCAVDNTGEIIIPNNDWDHAFRESSRPRRP